MGRKCFIITPIGEESSITFRKAKGVIEGAIKPILRENNFTDIKPAYEIMKSGMIGNQIIDRIFNDDLVIANLTGNNPNVMYELAVRHLIGKPIIHICERGTILSFDIKDNRTIFYSDDMLGTEELKKSLKNYIININYEDKFLDNPILNGIDKIREINFQSDSNIQKGKIDLYPIGEKIDNDIISKLNKIETFVKETVEYSKAHKNSLNSLLIQQQYLTDNNIRDIIRIDFDEISEIANITLSGGFTAISYFLNINISVLPIKKNVSQNAYSIMEIIDNKSLTLVCEFNGIISGKLILSIKKNYLIDLCQIIYKCYLINVGQFDQDFLNSFFKELGSIFFSAALTNLSRFYHLKNRCFAINKCIIGLDYNILNYKSYVFDLSSDTNTWKSYLVLDELAIDSVSLYDKLIQADMPYNESW